MKTIRLVLGIVVIIVLGVLAWQYLPGCRQHAKDAYRKYGGWTDAARREDPVGFIEYAEQKLNENLMAFRDTQASLAGSRKLVEDGRAHAVEMAAKADELAGKFRDAFRAAEGVGGYPVTVAGAQYTRDELLEQVRLTLTEGRNYRDIIRDYEAAGAAVDEKGKELVTQIADTKAALAQLPARKDIARVNELAANTSELLQQVKDLLDQNEEVLSSSPVRTVEELTRSAGKQSAPGWEVDVEAFLRAGE
jgi:phage shock protein A